MLLITGMCFLHFATAYGRVGLEGLYNSTTLKL